MRAGSRAVKVLVAAPDVVVSTDFETLIGLLARQLAPADALATGALEIHGDPAALSRFVEIFAWPLASEPPPQFSGAPEAAR